MRRALLAELTRVATVRSLCLGACLAALVAPLGSLLVAGTGGVGPEGTVASTATSGAMLGLLGIAVWAASAAAGEYAHGTIEVTLVVTGSRRRVVLAKVGALAALAGAAGLVAAVLGLVLVWSVQPPGLVHVGSAMALLAMPLTFACVGAASTAAGFLARSPVAAIAVVGAALLIPQAAAGLWGGLERWVIGASPGLVITEVVNRAQLPVEQTFPPGPSAAVVAMVALTAIVVATAVAVVQQRDGG